MIARKELEVKIQKALGRSRVVALLGPRQSGKTTLARQFVRFDSPQYFDLEEPEHLVRLEEPMSALRPLRGLVVIDEVQRKPDLFPILRVLADRKPLTARFLILGSASPVLLQQSSESLSGRIEVIDIHGFTSREVAPSQRNRLWLRGGFPLSFLAKTDADSFKWRKNFVQMFLERDLPQLGIGTPAATLLRFWTMLAHYHGQIWKASEPARSMGVGESSVRRYLDLLSSVFMMRQLHPWHENLKKRQVKSPKIYFRDTGLLHYLLGIRSQKDLEGNPKRGASWEGYVIEEALRFFEPDEAYFWATHTGAELDLMMIKKGRRIGVECKFSDAPKLSPSMIHAMKDLKLKKLYVIYPGKSRYPLAKNINTIPFEHMIKEITF
ncbi:MAG: ATP-binding protein [Candidatus Omnitrophica bacterium]|nr:ATP-binding protein [Candidatus Omnitrophota bacterium]